MTNETEAERLVIRPLSDAIYFYPSIIAAIICGIVVESTGANAGAPGQTGLIFTLIFFFNLTIVSFNYTRTSSIVIGLLVLVIVLLSTMYPAVGDAFVTFMKQPLFMNSTFYWVFAGGLFGIVMTALIKARFNFWEIKNNELVHHHGLLGDTERWPAPNMRVTKEIKDVMEYLLCRSGRLVLIPQREHRAIILDNVVGIAKIEVRMQRLLNTLRVDHADD